MTLTRHKPLLGVVLVLLFISLVVKLGRVAYQELFSVHSWSTPKNSGTSNVLER